MQKPVLFLLAGAVLALSLGFLGSPAARAGWCNGRSSASLAALEIRWETVEKVAKAQAPVTGDVADPDAEAPSPFAGLDKPVVVFVADTTLSMSDFDKLQEIVFKNEKIGLAMKAFHHYRISPEDADLDPILAEKGKNAPRLVIIDPLKESAKVLEEGKIKVSGLYKAMKTVSNRFYKEKLDKLVKTHLKLLTERDQLANEVKVLTDKRTRLEEKGDKGKKDIEKIEEELADVEKELQELKTTESELWTLTPKKSPA